MNSNTHVDNPLELPTVLSICTGIRGLERGLNRAIGRSRTVAHVEIEAFAVENLLTGMEAGILDPAPIWTDVKSFPAYPFRNAVDFLLGGYPCQPFSTAGKRAGEDDPRHLWPHIENIIGTVNPVCCFFENVSGHLSLGFDQVYRSLSDMGYSVEAGIFTAEEVGAPHQRERLFILSILADAEGARIRRMFGNLLKENGRPDGELQFVAKGPSEELEDTVRTGIGNKDGSVIGGAGRPIIRQDNRKECSVRIESASELADTGSSSRWPSSSGGDRDPSRDSSLQREGPEVAGGFGECGQEMANPNSKRSGSGNERTGWEKRSNLERGSIWAIMEYADRNVGHPSCIPKRESSNQDIPQPNSREAWQEFGQSGTTEGVVLDDTFGEGFQGHSRNDSRTQRRQEPRRSITPTSIWPAGPGQSQHEWEEPRIIGNTQRLPSSIRKLWHQVRPHFEKIMGKEIWTETDRNIKAAIESGVGCTVDGYNFREDLLRAFGNSVVEQTAELAFRTLYKKHFPDGPCK